jgi:hypothetical protein
MPEAARLTSRKAMDNEARLKNISLMNIGFPDIRLIIQTIFPIEG